MTSLLANKDRYIENFANSVYVEYRRLNYGIKSCKPVTKLYIDEMRKEIIDYYELGNGFTCPKGCTCPLVEKHMMITLMDVLIVAALQTIQL